MWCSTRLSARSFKRGASEKDEDDTNAATDETKAIKDKTTQAKATQAVNAQVMSEVTSAITNADNNVTQGVQSLSLVHQARLAQLTRTAVTVSARYGASSAQAKAAKAAVTASQATVTRLAILKNRVSLVAPQVPAKGWALYGHIYHSTLKPAVAYTVFF